ncbi:MAG: TatD family hydrolase [Acidobacteria bacterium]|nr:TatD family hydrolase [Acidobacteriota bacterium]
MLIDSHCHIDGPQFDEDRDEVATRAGQAGVVANLKPRKMRGLESQGMICAASLEDGTGEKPALTTFFENVDIGARLK